MTRLRSMGRRSARASLALAGALLAWTSLGGCYTMRADVPGTWRPSTPNEDVVIVGRIDRQMTHWFFLYGLLPPPAESLYAQPLLAAVEDAGGDGVANLVIDSEFTTTDVLFRGLTLGIVAPRTYRVRADVVKLPGPPPPGRALLQRGPRPRVPTSTSPTTAPPPLTPPPPTPPPLAPPLSTPLAEPPAPLDRGPADPSDPAPPAPLGAP